MSSAAAPVPEARLAYHTEPHPDPLVQALIERVEALLRENAELKEKLQQYGSDPR